MSQVETRQVVDVFMPYYLKVGNVFSEEFLRVSAKRDLFDRNELDVVILQESADRISMRCAKDPNRCRFRLEFTVEIGEVGTVGWRMIDAVTSHYCAPRENEWQVINDRKRLIRFMRPDIIKIVERTPSRSGNQQSKDRNIMSQLAFHIDQYPSFLIRGLCRDAQRRIKKYFEAEVARIRKALSSKRKGSSRELQALLDNTEEESMISDPSSISDDLIHL